MQCYNAHAISFYRSASNASTIYFFLSQRLFFCCVFPLFLFALSIAITCCKMLSSGVFFVFFVCLLLLLERFINISLWIGVIVFQIMSTSLQSHLLSSSSNELCLYALGIQKTQKCQSVCRHIKSQFVLLLLRFVQLHTVPRTFAPNFRTLFFCVSQSILLTRSLFFCTQNIWPKIFNFHYNDISIVYKTDKHAHTKKIVIIFLFLDTELLRFASNVFPKMTTEQKIIVNDNNDLSNVLSRSTLFLFFLGRFRSFALIVRSDSWSQM